MAYEHYRISADIQYVGLHSTGKLITPYPIDGGCQAMMVGWWFVVEVWVGVGREGSNMSPWRAKTYMISGRVTHFYVKS